MIYSKVLLITEPFLLATVLKYFKAIIIFNNTETLHSLQYQVSLNTVRSHQCVIMFH